MMTQLKAEFKKLLTVRSTFIVSIAIVLLTGLLMFAMNTKTFEEVNQPPQTAEKSQRPDSAQPIASQQEKERISQTPKLTNKLPANQLETNLQNVMPVMSLLITITVILLMAHEYRYNTIMHTLTLTNRRSKVLSAKIIVGLTYTLVMTMLVIASTVLFTHLAVNIKDLILPQQEISWFYASGRLLMYALGYSMLGLAIIVLIRNLVASIVAIFILPMIEGIAGAILSSHNVQTAGFLPFTALNRIASLNNQGFDNGPEVVSVPHATLVFGAYLIGLWAVAWYLFLRRDAN